MKPLVFNLPPLIYITKIGLSRILEELEGEKLTLSVKREIADKGGADLESIEKMGKNKK